MQVEQKVVKYFAERFETQTITNDDKFKNYNNNDITKKIAAKEGYISYTAKEQKLDANGGNFLGELYLLDIKGKTKEGSKETNIFVKRGLTKCNLPFVDPEILFAKEMLVYGELSKIFDELQTNAHVPETERYEIVKCYHSIEGKALFMENMIKKGFSVPNRMEAVTLDYAESCIKTLARFHGLSFVLQKVNGDFFEKNIKSLKFTFALEEEWLDICENSLKRAISVLRTEEYRYKIESLLPGVRNNLKDFYIKKEDARVLCHGDYRSNNILMKKTVTGDIKTIPLDFQAINYGNPMNDFMYFIFVATDKVFRRNHLNDLKELYYTTLADFLKYFDMGISDVYPRNVFESDYKSRFEYGLIISTLTLQFVLAPEDDFPDFSGENTTTEFPWSEQFKYRMRELFEDYIEWGFV